MIAYGERLFAVVRGFLSDSPQQQIFYLRDWIQALHVFSEKQERNTDSSLQIALLSINNATQLMRLDNLGGNAKICIWEEIFVQSSYKSVM
ncbi:unnamed protein product, partial [Gongylonema pulchrum]